MLRTLNDIILKLVAFGMNGPLRCPPSVLLPVQQCHNRYHSRLTAANGLSSLSFSLDAINNECFAHAKLMECWELHPECSDFKPIEHDKLTRVYRNLCSEDFLYRHLDCMARASPQEPQMCKQHAKREVQTTAILGRDHYDVQKDALCSTMRSYSACLINSARVLCGEATGHSFSKVLSAAAVLIPSRNCGNSLVAASNISRRLGKRITSQAGSNLA